MEAGKTTSVVPFESTGCTEPSRPVETSERVLNDATSHRDSPDPTVKRERILNDVTSTSIMGALIGGFALAVLVK